MDPSAVLLAGGAYLIGSISFARIVGRLRAPHVALTSVDYPVAGSDDVWVYRGVSATSVSEKLGLRWGLLVVALDITKGFVPTLTVRLMWPEEVFYLWVGVGLVIGHVWPMWHRFIGGRGQSVLIGSVAAVDVLALPIAIVFGVIAGLMLFTSSLLAREGFGLWIWVWPLVSSGVNPVLWLGLRFRLSTCWLSAPTSGRSVAYLHFALLRGATGSVCRWRPGNSRVRIRRLRHQTMVGMRSVV